jgi:hypothetical protein
VGLGTGRGSARAGTAKLGAQGRNAAARLSRTLIASIAIVQTLFGIWLDGRYDPRVRRYLWWAPLYPLIYWVLTALVAVRSTAGGIVQRPTGTVTWTQQRFGGA